MSYGQFGTGAEVSWVQTASSPKCLYTGLELGFGLGLGLELPGPCKYPKDGERRLSPAKDGERRLIMTKNMFNNRITTLWGVRTCRPIDGSPHGRSSPHWTFRPMADSP